jgi:hypothetical protein
MISETFQTSRRVDLNNIETRGGNGTYPGETRPNLCCAADIIQFPVSQRESAKVKFES